jgi:hypothetical protein
VEGVNADWVGAEGTLLAFSAVLQDLGTLVARARSVNVLPDDTRLPPTLIVPISASVTRREAAQVCAALFSTLFSPYCLILPDFSGQLSTMRM